MLGTSAGTATANLAICAQPTGGGALVPLQGLVDDDQTQNASVTVNTDSIPYASSMAGYAPANGTYLIGMCVNDVSGHPLDANDYSTGFALVTVQS